MRKLMHQLSVSLHGFRQSLLSHHSHIHSPVSSSSQQKWDSSHISISELAFLEALFSIAVIIPTYYKYLGGQFENPKFREIMENSASENSSANTGNTSSSAGTSSSGSTLSRYENQKRRDWNTFGQYLKNHRPPLFLSRCSGAHVLEFLRYLDQFGKTKVHIPACPFYGHPNPPAPCPCPLRQAWGSLDALIGRLRAAYEENGGKPETNPFGARAVRLYLREVRDLQSKARGISYEKKKRKRPQQQLAAAQLIPPPPPQG